MQEPVNDGEKKQAEFMPPAAMTILAEIEALKERMKRRKAWSRAEIYKYLEWAEKILNTPNGTNDAKNLLSHADMLYLNDIKTSNRNWYLASMIIGIVLVVALYLIVCGASYYNHNLTSLDTVGSLFVFATMGSVTSVLIRISEMDLKNEMSKKFIIYLSVSKPIVAISFASVVYLILKHNMVTIGKFGSDQCEREAVWWIASFLCGFSERFASDLLGRVFPNGEKK